MPNKAYQPTANPFRGLSAAELGLPAPRDQYRRMISPKAFELIIRHLNAIDGAVSERVARKHPWCEPALSPVRR